MMADKRCAIYTRKSTEEGLDQEFNSLDAQREACEAYIKSQAHEGWKLVRKHYDDGGYSGGNLKRPALNTLLEDVQDGKIDIIVIYKIDRLTRSLMDFSKIVEVFDEANTSFVAVTQHFNTTSSMGRLTLNVLLSFAQFEREITGERIRDKIAASKEKGMWTGGPAPLGYDLVDKKLIVNPKEADVIRHLFKRYLAVASVEEVIEEFKEKKIKTKRWLSKKGNWHGGNDFSRGPLYATLQNRIYLGQVAFKDKIYDGKQDSIVSQELWDKVQVKLELNRKQRSDSKNYKSEYLLHELLFDSAGHPMAPTYSVKKGNRRYPYYVSIPIIGKCKKSVGDPSRIPAQGIEGLVRNRVGLLLQLGNEDYVKHKHVKKVIQKITVYKNCVELVVKRNIANMDTNRLEGTGDEVFLKGNTALIRIKATLQLRGRKMAFITQNGYEITELGKPDSILLKNLSVAYTWRELLESGEIESIRSLARIKNVAESFVRRTLPLAYLAPDIIESILDGNQPSNLDLKDYSVRNLPLSWKGQRRLLGYKA